MQVWRLFLWADRMSAIPVGSLPGVFCPVASRFMMCYNAGMDSTERHDRDIPDEIWLSSPRQRMKPHLTVAIIAVVLLYFSYCYCVFFYDDPLFAMHHPLQVLLHGSVGSWNDLWFMLVVTFIPSTCILWGLIWLDKQEERSNTRTLRLVSRVRQTVQPQSVTFIIWQENRERWHLQVRSIPEEEQEPLTLGLVSFHSRNDRRYCFLRTEGELYLPKEKKLPIIFISPEIVAFCRIQNFSSLEQTASTDRWESLPPPPRLGYSRIMLFIHQVMLGLVFLIIALMPVGCLGIILQLIRDYKGLLADFSANPALLLLNPWNFPFVFILSFALIGPLLLLPKMKEALREGLASVAKDDDLLRNGELGWATISCMTLEQRNPWFTIKRHTTLKVRDHHGAVHEIEGCLREAPIINDPDEEMTILFSSTSPSYFRQLNLSSRQLNQLRITRDGHFTYQPLMIGCIGFLFLTISGMIAVLVIPFIAFFLGKK